MKIFSPNFRHPVLDFIEVSTAQSLSVLRCAINLLNKTIHPNVFLCVRTFPPNLDEHFYTLFHLTIS